MGLTGGAARNQDFALEEHMYTLAPGHSTEAAD